MIEYREMLLVGRHERPTANADRYIIGLVAERAFKAYTTLQSGIRRQIRETFDSVMGLPGEDKLQEEDIFWGAWNAVACVGPYARWTSFDFLELCHLGTCVAPWATRRWRYIPALNQMERVALPDGLGAPVVHGSSKLVSEEFVAAEAKLKGNLLSGSLMARLESCEAAMVRLGLDVNPWAQTRHGLREALAQLGYRMRDPNKIWLRPTDGTPWGLDRLSVADRQVQVDAPRLPHASTVGRPWATLDEALIQGMGQIDPRSP